MLISDLIPQPKKTKKKLLLPKQEVKQQEQFTFHDEIVQEFDYIDKLTTIVDITPLLPVIKLQQNVKTQLSKMIEEEEEQQISRQLKFRNDDISYLFALLLNETQKSMKVMKDSYDSEKEYLQHVIPLFINESLSYIKSTAVDQMKKYNKPNIPLPLRYQVKINRKNTVLGKYLVIEAFEGDFDQESLHTWKKTCFTEYLEFASAKSYIIQLIIQTHKGPVDLLGIIAKQEPNKKHLIYLPWNKRVIDAFKIPNIVVKDRIRLSQLQERYEFFPFPNFDELYPDEFLAHVNPIFTPATYLIELKVLLGLSSSKYLKLVLQPTLLKQTNPLSKYSYGFGQPLLHKATLYLQKHPGYNHSQQSAILEACDYKYPVTLINGPPGTGKTYTSLAIIDIVLEHTQDIGDDGIILCCGHSNTVINDWVRKIRQNHKVFRIGNADKCEKDIYDQCLEVVTQRQFYDQFLSDYDTKAAKDILGKNGLTLVHVKQRIGFLNERIYDLQDFQIDDQNQANSIKGRLQQMSLQKKELRRLMGVFSGLLGAKREVYKQMMQSNLQGVQVIVSTLTSSASNHLCDYLTNKTVNICLIDEAPMCFEPSVLIPITKHTAHKLVLIGDHHQLGPIIYDITNTKNFNYHRSLYERFLDLNAKYTMLNIQYRSMPNLSKMTSQFFYNSKIQDHHELVTKEFPKYLENKINNFTNNLLFDVHVGEQVYSNTNSYFNEYEAWGVVFLVVHLLKGESLSNKVISIITPYRAQVKKIKETLFRYAENLLDMVEVDTIDGFQGKENDIMIISLVRSEGLGFLSDLRRANVATSRAQFGQFIFCNAETLRDGPQLWYDLYQYMLHNGMIANYGQNELAYYEHYFNFDPTKRTLLTTPKSKKAMQILGLQETDLYIYSQDEIIAQGVEAEDQIYYVKLKEEHIKQRANAFLQQALKQRESVIDDNKNSHTQSIVIGNASQFKLKQDQLMRTLQNKQQIEIEREIQNELRIEGIQKKNKDKENKLKWLRQQQEQEFITRIKLKEEKLRIRELKLHQARLVADQQNEKIMQKLQDEQNQIQAKREKYELQKKQQRDLKEQHHQEKLLRRAQNQLQIQNQIQQDNLQRQQDYNRKIQQMEQASQQKQIKIKSINEQSEQRAKQKYLNATQLREMSIKQMEQRLSSKERITRERNVQHEQERLQHLEEKRQKEQEKQQQMEFKKYQLDKETNQKNRTYFNAEQEKMNKKLQLDVQKKREIMEQSMVQQNRIEEVLQKNKQQQISLEEEREQQYNKKIQQTLQAEQIRNDNLKKMKRKYIAELLKLEDAFNNQQIQKRKDEYKSSQLIEKLEETERKQKQVLLEQLRFQETKRLLEAKLEKEKEKILSVLFCQYQEDFENQKVQYLMNHPELPTSKTHTQARQSQSDRQVNTAKSAKSFHLPPAIESIHEHKNTEIKTTKNNNLNPAPNKNMKALLGTGSKSVNKSSSATGLQRKFFISEETMKAVQIYANGQTLQQVINSSIKQFSIDVRPKKKSHK